jgi:hypothetical protein
VGINRAWPLLLVGGGVTIPELVESESMFLGAFVLNAKTGTGGSHLGRLFQVFAPAKALDQSGTEGIAATSGILGIFHFYRGNFLL